MTGTITDLRNDGRRICWVTRGAQRPSPSQLVKTLVLLALRLCKPHIDITDDRWACITRDSQLLLNMHGVALNLKSHTRQPSAELHTTSSVDTCQASHLDEEGPHHGVLARQP